MWRGGEGMGVEGDGRGREGMGWKGMGMPAHPLRSSFYPVIFDGLTPS